MTFLFPRISASSFRRSVACLVGGLAVLGVAGCASDPRSSRFAMVIACET